MNDHSNEQASELHVRLTAYALGELSADERARVEGELATSEAARATLGRIEATLALVSGNFGAEASLGAERRASLLGAAEREPQLELATAGASAWRGPVVKLAAAGVLFTAGVALVGRGAQPEERTARFIYDLSGAPQLARADAPAPEAAERGGLGKAAERPVLDLLGGGEIKVKREALYDADDPEGDGQLKFFFARKASKLGSTADADRAAGAGGAPGRTAAPERAGERQAVDESKQLVRLRDVGEVDGAEKESSDGAYRRFRSGSAASEHAGSAPAAEGIDLAGAPDVATRSRGGEIESALELSAEVRTGLSFGVEAFDLSGPAVQGSDPQAGTLVMRAAPTAGEMGAPPEGIVDPAAVSLGRLGVSALTGTAGLDVLGTPPSGSTAVLRSGEELRKLGYAFDAELLAPGAVGSGATLGLDWEFARPSALGLEQVVGVQTYGELLALAARSEDPDVLERVVRYCDVLPRESARDAFYRFWGENAPVRASVDALSTFAADVDTASFREAGRMLRSGRLPTVGQVRTEEFINAMPADLEPPREGAFGLTLELAPSLFAGQGSERRWLLRAGVRGRDVHRLDRQPLALTFVVDTSGSMRESRRMELVKQALGELLGQLDANDSVAIVGFAKAASLIQPMTSAMNPNVRAAIERLVPDGGTNAEAGIVLGYEHAAAQLTPGSVNRVVLLSDGMANIGETDQDAITQAVTRFRRQGIYLNTIGVGLDEANDVFLEQLADRGDGICDRIASAEDARRALVENMTAAFEPIARDVKIQVEFDPAQVARYRLLGYENRAVADADFRNDAVDGGELGAGHQVVALYELELSGRSSAPLATLRVRHKQPYVAGGANSEAASETVAQAFLHAAGASFEAMAPGFRRSAVAAQLAEVLRLSPYAQGDDLELLAEQARALRGELAELVALARPLIEGRPRPSELVNLTERLRWNACRLRELEESAAEGGDRGGADRAVAERDELQGQRELLLRRLDQVLAESRQAGRPPELSGNEQGALEALGYTGEDER